MKKLLTTLMLLTALLVNAQTVKVTWALGDVEAPEACTISGDASGTSLVTGSYAIGNNLTITRLLAESNVDDGYSAVTYDPPFMAFQPSAQVSSATSGHNISVGVTPASGHKFKPTKVSFDACKVGTDGGGIIVKVKESGGTEKEIEAITPLRNKIGNGNSTGYSHHEFYINDYNVEDKAFLLILYITGIGTNKEMAIRNIAIEGTMDSQIWTVGDFLSDVTCKVKPSTAAAAAEVSLYDLVKGLKNGETVRYATKLYEQPSDFMLVPVAGLADSETMVAYDSNKLTATISGLKNGVMESISFNVIFTVTSRPVKPAATPLKRGLMALHQSSGNLVSWRARATDDRNVRFRLWKGSASVQFTEVSSLISGKTNYFDANGTASQYYRLEVLDAGGSVIETEVSGKTWDNQTFYIPLTAGAPTDPSGNGATYEPNDASYCDMDGDGEYEIILKLSPSNEKDAASSGATSNVFFDC